MEEGVISVSPLRLIGVSAAAAQMLAVLPLATDFARNNYPHSIS
ncbi:hypothetical protein ACOJBM_39920 [Rhizobium beringeri]